MNEGEGSGGEARAMEREEERTFIFAPSFFFSTPFSAPTAATTAAAAAAGSACAHRRLRFSMQMNE
jgi:hypothetical protein